MASSRGQVGVEFFLVISFLFAMAAVLLSSAESVMRDVDSLNNAALSKSAVDSIAAMVNYVYLSGNYSQATGEVFVPRGSVCFIFNSSVSPRVLQCDADPSIAGRVESREVLPPSVSFNASCPPASSSRGWFRVYATNLNNSVTVNCTNLG